MIYVWLIILIVAILLEVASTALVSIWFGVGALAGFVAALLGAPIWLQVPIAIVFSVVMLIFTRPLLKKLMVKAPTPTNSELLIGKTATVTETIDMKTAGGRVSVNGVNWGGISENGDVIEAGQLVTIKEIKGSKLVVVLS